MKKLVKSSKVLFVFSLLLFVAVNFIPTDSSALVPDGGDDDSAKKKKVKSCVCQSGGQTSSWGNTCIEGSGACVANDCPANTTAKCD